MAGLYMAPEVYKNEIFDKKVDSFSFGLILFEVSCLHVILLSLKFPFKIHIF